MIFNSKSKKMLLVKFLKIYDGELFSLLIFLISLVTCTVMVTGRFGQTGNFDMGVSAES